MNAKHTKRPAYEAPPMQKRPAWKKLVKPYKNWSVVREDDEMVVLLRPGADINSPKSGEIQMLMGAAATAWRELQK